PVFHRDFRNCVRLRYPSAGRRRDFKPYRPPPPGRSKKTRPRRRISLITEAAAAAAAAEIAATAAAAGTEASTADDESEADEQRQRQEEQLGLGRAIPELLVTNNSPLPLSPVASSGLMEEQDEEWASGEELEKASEVAEGDDEQPWFEDDVDDIDDANSQFDSSAARELLAELLDDIIPQGTGEDDDLSAANSLAASVAFEAVQSAIDEVCGRSGGSSAVSPAVRSFAVSAAASASTANSAAAAAASAATASSAGRSRPASVSFAASREESGGGGADRAGPTLKEFGVQLDRIWGWIGTWPEFERINLLSELVTVCSQQLIAYLADCIMQRIHDCTDIGILPDRTLLKIFSLLPVRDLLSCAQVSRHWWVLASHESIWLRRCEQIGFENGLLNLAGVLRQRLGLQHIDWKLTYGELERMLRQARQSLPLPRHLTHNAAVDGEAKAKRREQQQQLDGVSVLERIHREYADRRPLMKPILGRLKQFQDSEDVALDIRPRLVEATDLTEKSESKERLIYKKDLEKLGQRGAFVGDILPILQCRLLQGHLDAVQCLQFDERRLVTGSRDMSVRIWDVRSGRSIRKLYGHKGGVTCLHMRDNVLATGSWDMSVMLWSLEPDFRRLRMLTDHEDSVCYVHILPGSRN
uniref:F-box domain-containing protein n=1 Tax=Macrostomum lignano TaxID=282301 RepID=A0A1I8GRM3_9PLAT